MTGLPERIRQCTLCKEHLPLEPRPIVQLSRTARILVIGQAPGRITHESGIPFDDMSGNRLAEWMGVSAEELHDPARIAIASMGFCYPGKAKGGDKPPRPECAPKWHREVLEHLPEDRLTLLVGAHAQRAYLPGTRDITTTRRIAHWRDYLPRYLPLPHPSWRSTIWMRKNRWFSAEVLPALQARIATTLGAPRD